MRVFQGFMMALADSVPGVSGGTVAFLMGFYDALIGALRHIASPDRRARLRAHRFLLLLGSGWAAGMALAMLTLNGVMAKYSCAVSSLFLGFVLASIPTVAWKERGCLLGHLNAAPMIAAGFALVFAVTYFSTHSALDVSLTQLTPLSALLLFVAVAAAISAMILPGISGSSLLMTFGLYVPLVARINALLHGDFSALPIVAVFGLGALLGLLGFVQLLNRALKRRRAQVMYAVLGMMAASLYAVVMGPTTLDVPQPALSAGNFSILWFLIGCGVIAAFLGFERAANRKTARR